MARTAAKSSLERTIHVFKFLELDLLEDPVPDVTVLHGGDSFLQGLALQRIQQWAGDAGGLGPRRIDGSAASWRDVRDELSSQSLFDDTPPLVIVEDADSFISAHRAELEKYVAQPGSGRLVLLTKSWLKTTRLYKLLLESGLAIDCGLPQRTYGKTTKVERPVLVKWLVKRADSAHDLKVDAKTVESLIDLVGETPGLLDQEFAKLSAYVGRGKRVSATDLAAVGSGWSLRTTWDLVDRIQEGDAAEAIRQLHRLLQSGQEPIAVFGAISWSLRRFAAAARHTEWQFRRSGQRNLVDALRAAGFRDDYPARAPVQAERQLRRIGRERATALLPKLIEIDLRLKGSHSAASDARRLLEELIIGLCTPTVSQQSSTLKS